MKQNGKSRKSIEIAAVVILAAYPAFAGSDEAEFLKLREKHDAALAEAAKPINEDYRNSLKQLLQHAIDDGDKDTAALIQFEIQSLSADGTAPLLSSGSKPANPELAALQIRLSETQWRLSPDKTFVLHADGTTTSNWTPRRGTWKVVGANELELGIWNVAKSERVTVGQSGTWLTWVDKEPDQLHPLVAKKIAWDVGK